MAHPEFFQEGFEKQLAHVVEECAEVIVVYGKIQRFGKDSVNPLLNKEEQIPHIQSLKNELQDLKGAIARLEKTLNDN